MTLIMYIVLLLMIVCFIFLLRRCSDPEDKRSCIPRNWPIIGMLPGVFLNLHRFHDYVADALRASGGTFVFKGPWFGNYDILLTTEPANIHHILSKKFTNFGKGPQFKKIFEALGDGIIISEAESWELQRKTTLAILHNRGFKNFLVTSVWDKVEKGMIPVLDNVANLQINVDLQDLIERLFFDLTCLWLLDDDPASLSVEIPKVPLLHAFSDVEEAVLYRHILPVTVWRLQRWFQIGKEKKMSNALDLINEFLEDRIASKREKLKNMDKSLSYQEESFDFLTGYMRALQENRGGSDISDKIWRDTMFNLIFSGNGTTGAALTWFFWLLAKNPVEEKKVREEIITKLNPNEIGGLSIPKEEELNSLVYLHGALSESLRLFPPIAHQHKAPIEADILPSGHHLKPNTMTVLSFYSMGRMENIWGKDCLDFKPERWITEQGGIKNVPSSKFATFNAGPRSCLAKEMAYTQMKIVASVLLYHFEFKVVESQTILPTNAVIITVKDGLKVRVTRRSIHQ